MLHELDIGCHKLCTNCTYCQGLGSTGLFRFAIYEKKLFQMSFSDFKIIVAVNEIEKRSN
jgi:hypothetical protein